MDFRMEDTYKIINLYQQFPCLWDYQSPSYKRIDKKKNAWEEIAKNMGRDEETVKKKIKNLRSAYLAEKKKVESSKKSGMCVDDVYTPHLFYFEEMSFLKPSLTLRETKSNFSISNEDIEEIIPDSRDEKLLYDSFLCSDTETPVVKRRNLKRKAMRDEKINSVLDAIISQSVTENETMFSTFGRSVGMQLEQMQLSSAMQAMAAIQKLIADMMRNKDVLEIAMQEANLF